MLWKNRPKRGGGKKEKVSREKEKTAPRAKKPRA